MGWCQQCCALMRKNRILKCRLWGSTCAEIILPMIIMLIMVGLRAAVSKDDTIADLHYKLAVKLTQDQIYLAGNTSQAITNGSLFDKDNGPTVWDPQSFATYFYIGDRSLRKGVEKVKTIQFVPAGDVTTTEIENMAAAFKAAYPIMQDNVFTTFATDKALETYIRGSSYASSAVDAAIAVAVVVSRTGNDWLYTIRGNSTGSTYSASTLDTDQGTVNTLQTVYDADDWAVLMLEGHHLMQDFIDNYIIKQALPATTIERSYTFQPFPTPPYIKDDFADVISSVLGLFFTIIYMWPVTRLVKGIVEEKQLRIKESMRMMGLPDSALFCSWIGTYIIMFAVTSLLITLVTSGSVYKHSNKFYIFIFFFFFSLSTFSFCWLVSVFFSRSQVATTFAALIFLGIFFPYFAVEGASSSQTSKTAAALSSPVCFGLGAVVIQKLESSSGGVNSNTVSVMVDNFSYNTTIGMFVADFFIYLILALYFQQVVPSEWGTHQKWYFLFQPSWWCPKTVSAESRPRAPHHEHELAHLPQGEAAEGASLVSTRNADSYFEQVTEEIKATLGVSIQNLRRVFESDGAEPFVAVKGANLDLYDGQILALLGTNGAGKTTIINMLCGMIAPTSGEAFVYGSPITQNMSGVRKILGVCPQHNILYELLTVREHFDLFAAIKGVPSDLCDAQITEMIAQVGLAEKSNEKSAALSGGMQRKLSVGIALLGDSRIVFLDEPTSGMDPYSRRATWDLLQRKKPGRVIVLTTHFMDEADQLGDRIAIMDKGVIKCCGSSLFLKNRYGVGYTLTIVKGDNFDQAAVSDLINSRIPDVTSLSNMAGEISFRLPFQASPFFADVFDEFDLNQEAFGISSYGISVTTLEEVFLRVGHEDDADPAAVVEQRKTIQECQRKMSASAMTESPDEPGAEPGAHSVVKFHLQDQSRDGSTGGGSAREAPRDGESLNNSPELVIHGDKNGRDSQRGHSQAHSHQDHSHAHAHGGGLQTVNVQASQHVSAEQSAEHEKKKMMRRNSSRFAELRIPDKSVPMFRRHFHALFVKRWLNAKRDRKVWTWTLLYPFLILLLGIGLIELTVTFTHSRLNLSVAELKQTGGGGNVVPVVYQSVASNSQGVFNNPSTGTSFADISSFVPAGLGIQNMSNYLIDTLDPTPRQEYSRYNAFYTDFQSDSTNHYVDNFVVFFNTSCQWASSFGLNMYNNQLLKHFDSPTTISVSIHPMPSTLNQQTLISSLAGVIVSIGFAFMPANFIAYAVKEEQDKVKHQQLISGVSALSYWSANFAWDFLNYMVMGLLCLLIFRIWSIDDLIGSNTGATFLTIVLFGLSIIPFNYCMSFLFTESTSAQNSMLLFYIFSGALLLIAIIVMSIISSTKSAAYHLRFVLRLLPSFAFGEAISNILTRGSSTLFGTAKGLWDMDVTGWPLLYMAIESIVYFSFVLVYEKVKATPALMAKIFGNPVVDADNIPDDDVDVINERTRLQGPDGQNDMIRITGLRKVYKGRLGGSNKIAVQDLWMGIPEGQCFGFLGTNGAGKTTALKMLTGDFLPNSGTATLNGLDILTHQSDVRRLIGYCPQFDALIDTLTAREHLVLFARIKGVPEETIDDYVEHLIIKLGLQAGIADKPSKGYSGGNKRKLCVGMALIGNPPIVFLDEPSTGMDPRSRRFLWDLIASTMKNRSVILTTHSMEECEALCNRITIMVSGRLRCIGSTAHLKQVYGDGYQLHVNVGESRQGELKGLLEYTFGSVSVLEEHGSDLKFRIPRQLRDGQKTTIGSVFRLMEAVKKPFEINDYSVSETSLEQIFIHFAKQ